MVMELVSANQLLFIIDNRLRIQDMHLLNSSMVSCVFVVTAFRRANHLLPILRAAKCGCSQSLLWSDDGSTRFAENEQLVTITERHKYG